MRPRDSGPYERGNVRQMITAVLMMAGSAVPSALPGQSGATATARDSIPSFDQLAREVLVVRVQAEALRGSISAVLRGRRDAASIDVGTPAWNDSVRAAQTNLERVEADVRQLEAGFRGARHRRGVRLVAELTSLLGKTRRALGELSQAADAQAARIALTHLVAGLEALLQSIDRKSVV